MRVYGCRGGEASRRAGGQTRMQRERKSYALAIRRESAALPATGERELRTCKIACSTYAADENTCT